MIVQVWRRAREADIGPVVVACAEQAIFEAVCDFGGEAVITDPDHPSGSDRIHEALGTVDSGGSSTLSSIFKAICQPSTLQLCARCLIRLMQRPATSLLWSRKLTIHRKKQIQTW